MAFLYILPTHYEDITQCSDAAEALLLHATKPELQLNARYAAGDVGDHQCGIGLCVRDDATNDARFCWVACSFLAAIKQQKPENKNRIKI